MTELSREIGEIWSRLFDHRPFLNGEIKFMLKEFEEKRGDREVENLFSILEDITEIKDTQVDKISRISTTGLPVLKEKLQQALDLTEIIDKDYKEIEKESEKKRLENKEKRKEEWDQFIDDMNFRCKRIDNTFEEKEEELRSLVDTNVRIYPSKILTDFLKTIPVSKEVPSNILNIIKDHNKPGRITNEVVDSNVIQLFDSDFETINKVKSSLQCNEVANKEESTDKNEETLSDDIKEKKILENTKLQYIEDVDKPYLTTIDLDWLYIYLKNKRTQEKSLPYLHELLEGAELKMPNNIIHKRNPDLEARCVKLRAQQEAREYRKMTKGVDNVRIHYPEDSIAYQMKQLNRHLIAIGQFLLSIFAGFLFGFRGVEWMVGNLDFGFRLLLGVMCALIIALAEIYFLAKKINEELSVPETVQLGGPVKFVNDTTYVKDNTKKAIEKEHQD
ncbi:unnamed protein product [Leptosia nina]|uniref:Biogenesis of lysosome-related organelles complex 1 subunit 5 n=1 Tax=Leptosia nina TaxID=320188 RepID=A0AAV1J688_9NEOP